MSASEDGADVTQGAKADAAVTNPASSGSVIALLKGLLSTFASGIALATQGYGTPATITRPANQTAYTALDVVGGALDLGVMGPSAAQVMLTGASLELDITAIPSGMTSFTLHLYNVTPPSAIADNAAFDLPSGDRASYLGSVNLGSPVDLGSTLFIEVANLGQQKKLAGTHLFGYLVTTGAFTPAANSEVYVVTLRSVAV